MHFKLIVTPHLGGRNLSTMGPQSSGPEVLPSDPWTVCRGFQIELVLCSITFGDHYRPSGRAGREENSC